MTFFTIFNCFYRPNTENNNVVLKDAQCSETDFCVHDLFCAIFSFRDNVDFVFNSELSDSFLEANPHGTQVTTFHRKTQRQPSELIRFASERNG